MGEAHYRDLMLRLQDECARVVTALETQLQCVQQHNTLLLQELSSVRALAQEWRETSEMQSEEMTSKVDETSALRRANEELRHAVETDRTRLEQQKKDWVLFLAQWEAERERMSLESQRASKQLKDAQMQVTEEQQRNAHMTQEIQLLQCRVESAVKTSRSFEQRLQHVTERRREEKSEWEAELKRLRRKLDDKREQAKYLAEALMEKESRPESSRRRRQQQHDDAHTLPGLSSDRERLRTRRRDLSTAPPASSTMPSRPEYVNKRSNGTEDKPDRYTYAPTSPTASSPAMSPPLTPQHQQQSEQQRHGYGSKPTGLPHLSKDQLNHTRMTTRTTTTTESTASSSPRSERLQRELSGLRRKLEACMLQVDTDAAL
ncbi:hypothetical protein Poli38472_001941 [Pythium oligandrum]|uniref:Uncharacterized protein n=1 Tax=Pythium oligandrum TaxID=41045 RepID=A0A8K1CW50_PYTOL|nr:hypothetical protein Poli38472_001941 [Pythium oligandrum]|eukprot:TMW69785.1 hypothetical protein Poli38472_001941 [Pythium oligandrum]